MSEDELPLAHVLVRLINNRDLELARASRLLHDQVGQVLSAAGLQLDLLRMDLKDQVSDIGARTQEIQRLLEQAVGHIRDLSYELNPSIVERAGLQFALARLVGRFRNTIPGTLRLMSDPYLRVPPEPATALYKIAEQAVENAVQHSGAGKIEVLLRPQRRAACFEVRDNGAGFAVGEVRRSTRGLGLLLMEHYAARGGLKLSISSAPGKGTIVKVLYAPKA